jgi:FKBP-type peptidyl-prolyl cis-trans isomerase FkpA
LTFFAEILNHFCFSSEQTKNKMKQIFLLLSVATLAFFSCGEDIVNQAEVDRNIINDYITANNLDAIEDPSGLFYTIDVPGTEDKPTLTDSVKVKYKGFRTDGFVFDGTNIDGTTPDKTVTFLLNDLITGWKIGIPKFGVGGSGLLLIPSALGYGSFSLPGIPANSVLIFEMELVDFF